MKPITTSLSTMICSVGLAQPLVYNVNDQVESFFNISEQNLADSKFAFIGDSITWRASHPAWFIRDHLANLYGLGGEGRIPLSASYNSLSVGVSYREGIEHNRSLAYTTTSANSGPRDINGYHSLDGNYTIIHPMGEFSLDFYNQDIILSCVTHDEEAMLDVLLNNEFLTNWSNIEGSSPTRNTISITSTDNTSLETVTLVNNSSYDFYILSSFQNDTDINGVVYSRIARGGAGPDDFNLSNNTIVCAELKQHDLDLLFIMLDWTGGSINRNAYENHLNEYLDFIRECEPNLPIILVTHHNFREDISHERDVMYTIAQQRDMGFINLYDLHPGGFDELDMLGFMDDSVHMTELGGQWFGNYIFDIINNTYGCPGDLNYDNQINGVDIGLFLDYYTQQNNVADWNNDGLINGIDISLFLVDYNTEC